MHVLTILCKDGWMPTNLSEGWRRLGCSVEEFCYGTHMGKSWNRQGLQENQRINAALLKTAQRLKSEGKLDLIFAVIYDDVLAVETAKQLRALDVPMVNYHVDLIGQWYRVLQTGRYFDRVACAQTDSWRGLKQAGIRPYYMPMAANPPMLEPPSTQEFLLDGVLYLGSPWLYRRRVLAGIAAQQIPLKIYGHNWLRQTADPSQAQPYRKTLHDLQHYLLPRLRQERWQRLWETLQNRLQPPAKPAVLSNDVPLDCIQGAYRYEDFYALVCGAAINLGFTHFLGAPGTPSERRQLRLREFEIPMHGGFYLTQDCAQLQELFRVGTNIAAWDSLPDLLDRIRYYLDHPAERQRIAQASQAHCLQHHTWAKRFSQLLQELKLSVPIWDISKTSASDDRGAGTR